jgi:ABC-2 type transport system ATP-binding protein
VRFARGDLWSKALALWLVAGAALVLSPAPVHATWPPPVALMFAVLSAGALFVALARRRPVLVIRSGRRAAFGAKAAFLVARSAGEEVVWRWFLLGAIEARAGWAAGLAVSTVAFATVHASGQGWLGVQVHLVTGATFGAIFLATGSIVAASVSHAAYNLLVAARADAERGSLEPPRRDAARAAQVVAKLRGAHKRLGSTEALSGVDLELRRGEILALLGPNGAGKSTVVAVLLGLRRLDRGEALLLGGNPRNRWSRSRVGATLQEIGFPPTLTVKEVVDLCRAHFEQPVPLETLLTRFGLAGLAPRQCGGLSGGQRRRLAVALAFAGSPEVAFLDEPTEGLDVDARRALRHELRRFADGGGTVLLTTHYLEEAETLADRVVVLHRGRVVADGSVAALKAGAGRARVRLASPPPPGLLEGAVPEPERGAGAYLVSDPPSFVRRLIEAGMSIDGLEITPVGLDEVFARLTDGTRAAD